MTPEKPKRTILVVDDEPGYRDMLEWSLRRDDVHVDTARDGQEAMRRLDQASYALVLTDITMPGVNGLKLLERVKKSNPSVPVILMTGFGSVETAVTAMKRGADDFILKPFDVNVLAERIHELLTASLRKETA
jgi:DNA-binding NtrC family response regulator